MLVLSSRALAANALDVARNGLPKESFYLAGNVGGRPVSVYAEGERLLVKQGDDDAKEIELTPPKESVAELPEYVCPAGVVGREAGQEPDKETPGIQSGQGGAGRKRSPGRMGALPLRLRSGV